MCTCVRVRAKNKGKEAWSIVFLNENSLKEKSKKKAVSILFPPSSLPPLSLSLSF